MSYQLLGQDLHETADRAKKFFSENYGATSFECEQPIYNDLPLKPTWQAKMKTGYQLCVNVQPSPFSPTLYEFVNKCAQRGLPIKLWVAVAQGAANATFSADLKQARDAGVGVVQLAEDGSGHEYHRAVPISLFALKKTDLKLVPKQKREEVKTAEATFLDGSPGPGCQSICQELEQVTRRVAEHSYNQGWWKSAAGAGALTAKFFGQDAWAQVLEEMEKRIDYVIMKTKSPNLSKQIIVRARAYTDWRNAVSHKPKTQLQLISRDAKLRTMFEATRDLLIEWYVIAKPLKLIN